VVFVVTWFAGLFYLPRLFVYHVASTDEPGLARFIIMERRLFAIMTVGALLAVAFGMMMLILAPPYLQAGWLRVKLLLVAGLIAYHASCYGLMRALRSGRRTHS
jgi:putative membrane protein